MLTDFSLDYLRSKDSDLALGGSDSVGHPESLHFSKRDRLPGVNPSLRRASLVTTIMCSNLIGPTNGL